MSAGPPSLARPIARLIQTFQAGLRALVPVAESAGIPWRDGQAYDDWDALAGSLYEAFVAAPIREDPTLANICSLAPYDLLKPSYEQHSLIIVGPDGAEPLALNRLSAGEGSFEEVEAVPLGAGWATPAGESKRLKLHGTQLRLLARSGDGGTKVVGSISE